MRKFLIGVGAAVLVLVVGIGVAIFLAVRGTTAIEAESKPYAEESVAAIATTWNREEYLRRAHPAARESTKPEDLKRLFEAFAAGLGRLVEFEPPQGGPRVSVTASQGKTVTANYVVNARFDKGPAVISISVVKEGGTWMILSLRVDSPALINNLMGRPS